MLLAFMGEVYGLTHVGIHRAYTYKSVLKQIDSRIMTDMKQLKTRLYSVTCLVFDKETVSWK